MKARQNLNLTTAVFFILLTTACKKEMSSSPSNGQVKPPSTVTRHITHDGSASSDVSYTLGDKSYLFNPAAPFFQFAYGDIMGIRSKLFIISQYTNSQIDDFLKGRLMIAESEDDGKTWINFRDINANFPGSINLSAPSFLKISDNHVMIFYLVKYSTKRIDLYMQESLDGCSTWSTPSLILGSSLGYQMINNARVELIGDRIVIPVSIPQSGDIYKYSISNNELKVFYYYSDDLGKSWNRSKTISSDVSLLEPGMVMFSEREWLMNIRTDIGKIMFFRSRDAGVNWVSEECDIISPSSPQTLLFDQEKNITLMVWNNTNKNFNVHGFNRSPLRLALSIDVGYSWKTVCDIENTTEMFDHAYAAVRKINGKYYVVYNEKNNITNVFKVKICNIEF